MIGRQKICLLLSNNVIDFSQLAVYLAAAPVPSLPQTKPRAVISQSLCKKN